MKKIAIILAICLFLIGCSHEPIPPKSVEAEVPLENVTDNQTTNYKWFNIVSEHVEIPIYPIQGIEENSILDLYDHKRYLRAAYGTTFDAHDEASLQNAIRSALQNLDYYFAILYTGDLNDVQEVVAKAYYSDPMILGTVSYLQYGIQELDNGYFLHFEVDYTIDKIQLTTKVKPKFEEFYAGLDLDGKSVDEKISIIHRAVIEQIEYVDSGYLYAHSPYGFFVVGEGVCQAYAIAMQMLLEKAGVESYYVVGYLVGEEDGFAHAWNLVKTENGWRHIDATWDDMGAQYEQQVNLTFYKLKDEVARQYYVWDESFYPKAE
ncbi:MAG TPA: transglutaminase domain-containing protein [Ureibacillus sp.]|nr:transglutaminase domain-containing protein [Ureibacillus sp.]